MSSALLYRNTIPNISATIFRKSGLDGIEKLLPNYRFAGDWFFYAYLLRSGTMSFIAESLNVFRRHAKGVTRQKSKTPEYLIELANVRKYIVENYPITHNQISTANKFLDKDYKVTRVKKNSTYSKIKPILKQVEAVTTQRKCIGIITTNNGSYTGGSEVLWRETADMLAKQKHKVVVLIKKWQPEPEFIQKMRLKGIDVYFKEDNGFENFLQHRPDLVLVSIGDQDEGIDYYRELKKKKIPYAIVNQLTKEARFWPIRENQTKDLTTAYKGAKSVFFTCNNNHKVMESRLGAKIKNSRIHFNPYHIDRNLVPKFPSTNKGMSIAIPSKLLFIHKGQDLIFDMIEKYPVWKTRELNFNFYGEGPDRINIERRISELGLSNCHLHGRLDDIGDIWKTNHALLMPSRMEGMPIMMISAMLSARTCIATDIGGHAEVIQDEKSGYIIPDPSVDDLNMTLEKAFQNRKNWKKMGELSRKTILEYLPEEPVENFVGQLNEIW